MEHTQSESWPQATIERIFTNITAERKRQGLSANDLSQACAEFGMPIARAVLSKMDNGLRNNISIPELLVIARALQVAPANLMFSPLSTEQVEYLPGELMDPMEAAGRLTNPEPQAFANPTQTALADYLRKRLATLEDEHYMATQKVQDAIVQAPEDRAVREAYEGQVRKLQGQIESIRKRLLDLGVQLQKEG